MWWLCVCTSSFGGGVTVAVIQWLTNYKFHFRKRAQMMYLIDFVALRHFFASYGHSLYHTVSNWPIEYWSYIQMHYLYRMASKVAFYNMLLIISYRFSFSFWFENCVLALVGFVCTAWLITLYRTLSLIWNATDSMPSSRVEGVSRGKCAIQICLHWMG